MIDFLDSIIFFLSDVELYVHQQFQQRELIDWLLFFFPFVVLFEAPRYFLPAVGLYVARIFGLIRDDRRANQAFMLRRPKVSIIVAGRNEGKIIADTIESLLALDYPNKEIIVIDDASTDNMYEICRPYANRKQIRLFRNSPHVGRGGRPVATNLGLRVARGEFILSVDADTSYDYDIIEHMIGPFHNPKVGVVAGNLKARNRGNSIWADFQAIEYMISIGVWKRWTSLIGTTMQASGAFGAFRREAVRDFGGWDPELAEDADISLKARKCGWEIVFAPRAIAMTSVPEDLITLVKQRIRWDKGAVRTYFHKHSDLMKFWRYHWLNAFEMVQEYILTYLLSFVYPIYCVYMLWYDFRLLIFAYAVAYMVYVAMSFFTLLVGLHFSERGKDEASLLWYTPIYPFYKEIFRWVRIYANIMETFRWGYRESYIPESGYRDSPTW